MRRFTEQELVRPPSDHAVTSVVVTVVGWAALVALLAGACAKSPTTVVTTLALDETVVAPLLVLNSTVVSDGDPKLRSSAAFVSLARGDAADRPAPYHFPMDLTLTVPVELAGPVTITVEGLDWDTAKVIARGTGTGIVANENATRASITLTAVNPGTSDGGPGDTATGTTDGVAADGDGTPPDAGAADGG